MVKSSSFKLFIKTPTCIFSQSALLNQHEHSGYTANNAFLITLTLPRVGNKPIRGLCLLMLFFKGFLHFSLLYCFFFFFASDRPISTPFVSMRTWREV